VLADPEPVGYDLPVMNNVTRILSSINSGDPRAAEELLPLVYDELRKLATARLAQEKPGQTLQATALVHEAYLRVVASPGVATPGVASPGRKSGESSPCWDSRRHFFAAAAEAMRRILIDQARRKLSAKRGGDRKRVPLEDFAPLAGPQGELVEDLLALDEALTQLEEEDPIKAQLVKLRYFTGASLEETAQLMDISSATAKRYWIYARSWLYGKLHGN
jgi:RNA polymerase sigma factor (sigma-70 family)